MRSPVYWHPLLYKTIMQFLYGSSFEERYKAIAALIPDGALVTEVCAGDAYLYKNYLQKKNVVYLGLDINSVFLKHAQQSNIPFKLFDLRKDLIAKSDFVIIHASLYQFIPEEDRIMQKLLDAANKVLIISEPIRNLSDSSNSIIRFLAKKSANPGKAHTTQRFNEKAFRGFCSKYPSLSSLFSIKGNREMIAVFKK